jgi:WD40 repeat protein
MPETKHNVQLPFTTSHAFIIGINDYEHLSPLSTAIEDAKVLAQQLAASHDYQVHGPLLNASKADLLDLLEKDMPEIVGPDDRVLFYFAGHGIALDSDDNPKGYLVPIDAEPGNTASLLGMDLLHQAFTNLPCKHGLLIMDCCFAGAFKWSTGFRDVVFDLPAIIYEERFYQYASDPAWQVITSSASDQKAVDILSNRTLGMRNESGAAHSPFAQALLDGLNGEADTVPKDRGDGVITATELYTYLRDRVEDETTGQGKRQSPSMFSLSRHDKGQFVFLHPRHPLNLPPIPDRNPFMGLKSYDEEDQLLFYGRDRVIKALYELINKVSFVVVSGVSGTGKSSVIKAGLLPILRKKEWNILPVIRPGKNPMQSLNTEARNLPDQLSKTQPSLLIIDQYEELITQCLHPEERLAFEEQLADWLKNYPLLHIIISIRSDFEPQFEEAALAQWWQQGRYVVPAFSQDELREVIIKPTIQEVLFFEPDRLVDKLVDAVNQAPGALPLLSFTLSELYHAYLNSGRTNRAFTLTDYEKLGGVIGALRTRANNIYDNLDETHQDSMRKLMIRMVSLEGGELASRRVFKEELIFSDAAETQRMQSVAQQLVSARLVSTGRDQQGRHYYEPAHDALVRAWARLWEWIKAQGEGKLSLMYKLSLAVSDYSNSKTNEYLWHNDPRLDLLHVDLSSDTHQYNLQEEAFLRESYALKRRNQRRRWAIIVGIIIGLAGLVIYAFIQQGIANVKTKEAQVAEERANVEAQNALILADSARAAQLRAEFSDAIAQLRTIEALDSANVAQQQREFAALQLQYAQANLFSSEARLSYSNTAFTEAFQNALQSYTNEPGTPSPKIQQLLAKTFQPLWDTPMLMPNFELLHDAPIQHVFLSPKEDKIITQTADYSLNLWDLSAQSLIASIRMPIDTPLTKLVFSKDQNTVLCLGKGGTVFQWDIIGATSRKIGNYSTERTYTNMYITEKKGELLYLLTKHSVEYWNKEGQLQDSLSGDFVAFNLKAGRIVVHDAKSKELRVFDLRGKLLDQLAIDELENVQIPDDGKHILILRQEEEDNNVFIVKKINQPGYKRIEVKKYFEERDYFPRIKDYQLTPNDDLFFRLMYVGLYSIDVTGPYIIDHQTDQMNLPFGGNGVATAFRELFLDEETLYIEGDLDGEWKKSYLSTDRIACLWKAGENGQERIIEEYRDPNRKIVVAIDSVRQRLLNSRGEGFDYDGNLQFRLSSGDMRLQNSHFFRYSDWLLTVSNNSNRVVRIWGSIPPLKSSGIEKSNPLLQARNSMIADTVSAIVQRPMNKGLVYHTPDRIYYQKNGEIHAVNLPFYCEPIQIGTEYKKGYSQFSPDGSHLVLVAKNPTYNSLPEKVLLIDLERGLVTPFVDVSDFRFNPYKKEITIAYQWGMVNRYAYGNNGLKEIYRFDINTLNQDNTPIFYSTGLIPKVDYSADGSYLIIDEASMKRVVVIDLKKETFKHYDGYTLGCVGAKGGLLIDASTEHPVSWNYVSWTGKPASANSFFSHEEYKGNHDTHFLRLPSDKWFNIVQGVIYTSDGDSIKQPNSFSYYMEAFCVDYSLLNDKLILFQTSPCVGPAVYEPDETYLYDITKNEVIFNRKERAKSFILTKDGKTIWMVFGREVVLWDIYKKQEILSIKHEIAIDAIDYSNQRALLLTKDEEGGIKLWKSNGDLIMQFELEQGIKSIAFQEDGQSFVTLDNHGITQLWLTPQGIFERYKKLIKK